MSVLPYPSVHRRAVVATGVVAVLALGLAACGSGDKYTSAPATHHGSSHSASASASGDFDQADVTFAQMMIPHHQQAVSMAKLADGRASDQEIKTLAADIEKAQGPEISTMQGWLASWGKPASPSMDHSMPGMSHGSGASMPGMMSGKDMTGLKAAKGKDFDKRFTEMMIGHHKGAITMAEDEQKNGRDPAAKKLAVAVVKNQQAEVDKMHKILDRL
ncbi:DUF305 domain-containing protein [Streptomyces sp. NBC_01306]|uniref:DUF305 domain-containing protein n=1 Tax=Streptomyces sp. NBC_01306 TaxID=2903819 RepID=UPI002252856F|nr:DUF305 domain-containing protein [Streptomyces sp. NBC_01306]MCX4728315.1 DUF305 domain-containing protein [Streptomyces sp. NBC_01306]